MDTLRLPICTRLATLTLLVWTTFAQNDTTYSSGSNAKTSDLTSCLFHVEDQFNADASINSTGSVNLHWNALMMDPERNDWTFTLTYNETRIPNRSTIHYLQSYISAPEASDARACVAMFGGRNATSSSGGRNGCDGVLSDACTSLLQEITYSDDCSFPSPVPDFRNRLEETCGAEILENGPVMTGTPQDLSNKTCTIAHPPASSSPDSYRTWSGAGKGVDIGHVDQNASDFTWYDLYAQQTIPFVVFSDFFNGVAETQVVCIAPRKLVGESRVPEKSSAASRKWQDANWMAVGGAVVASSLMLMVA